MSLTLSITREQYAWLIFLAVVIGAFITVLLDSRKSRP